MKCHHELGETKNSKGRVQVSIDSTNILKLCPKKKNFFYRNTLPDKKKKKHALALFTWNIHIPLSSGSHSLNNSAEDGPDFGNLWRQNQQNLKSVTAHRGAEATSG